MTDFSCVKVGDKVTFGSYLQKSCEGAVAEPVEWYVLSVEGREALLLSVNCLERCSYKAPRAETNYENSDLRAFLNGAFYDAAFTEEEKAQIVEVENVTPPCVFSGVGGEMTTDRVFALSVMEASDLIPNDEMRKAKVTDHAKAAGSHFDAFGNGWWWLRDTGNNAALAADVCVAGEVHKFGDDVHLRMWSARPAVRVKF